jgi:hypothetical protein
MAKTKTPEVIQDLMFEIKGKTATQIHKLIDSYFKNQIWSAEKDQWMKMNKTDRRIFVRVVAQRFSK